MGSSRNNQAEDVLRCSICGAVMAQGRGPRRRTCSARCRQAAQRQRDAARLAELKQAADAVAPWRKEAERRAALRASATHAITAGKAGQATAPTPAAPPARVADVDPIEQVKQAAAALDHAVRAALTAGASVDAVEDAAGLATLGAWIHRQAETTTPAKASRDDSVRAAATVTPAPAPVDEPDEEPDPARQALRALVDRGIQPHAQRLSRKKAQAIIDAAHLVRSPDHAETNRWLVTDGTTVLGTVSPTYGGTSRSGRTGWRGHVDGLRVGPYDHRPTRDTAALDVLDAWRRIVTSQPHTATSLFSDTR